MMTATTTPKNSAGGKFTASRQRRNGGGLAVLATMMLLISACGGDTLASGAASGTEFDSSRAATTTADSNSSGDSEVALPGDAPASDATGPGEQGWLPALDGPVERDGEGAIRGSIDSPGKKHIYTFEVVEGQHVLVDQLGGCQTVNGDRLNGRLEGPGDSGTVWFESSGDNCFDIDEFVFSGSGTATFTIEGSDEVTTGDYAFRLVDTTTPPPILITDGTTVAADTPTPGAGRIEAVGYNDHYQIEVQQDDAFTIQQMGCALSQDDSFSVRLEGAEVTGSLSNFAGDCDRTARFVAKEAGLVDLTVFASNSRLTGTYSFALNFVNDGPDQVQSITMGDAADPEATTPISGSIDEIGEVDRYSFEVEADQRFVIQQTGDCSFIGSGTLRAQVTGAELDESSYFYDGDCDTVDSFVASQSGTVTVALFDSSVETTGTYSFRVLNVPIAEPIMLESGDVVGPDQPAEGAGSIDALGERDVYLIDIEDNQRITITSTGACAITGSLRLRVEGETTDESTYLYDGDRDECFGELSFEAEETGTLSIVVSDTNNQVLGSYDFKVVVGSASAN